MSSPRTPRRGRKGKNDDYDSNISEPKTPLTDASSKQNSRTPRRTPSRTPSKRGSQKDGDVKSPPTQRRRVDSSPGNLAPMPSSPSSGNLRNDSSFLSSPRGVALTSEIDLSSPLNYGTPSSRTGGSTPRTPGLAQTPIVPRSDVRSDRRLRTVNVGGSELSIPSSDGAVRPSSDLGGGDANAGPLLVIWGTDVVVNHCKEKFRRFIETYVEAAVDQDERFDSMDIEQPIYFQRLEEINLIGEPFLNLNCAHLQKFDPVLYRQLVCYPQEVIPTFDMAANELFFERYPDTTLEHQIQIRPYNADITTNMRSLNPKDIDQLITINGMVIRSSNLIPEMREAFFQCHVCKNTATVKLEQGRIAEPTLCANCNTNHSFQLIHNRSQFTDKQMVKLQESPDDMPAGQTPHTVMLNAHNDLVDRVQPGDRISVTGIYRAQPLRVNPRQRNVKAVYRTHIDVVHYRKLDNKRLYETGGEGEEGEPVCSLPEERVNYLKACSREDGIYEKLAHSLAPSIYENIDVKKGILLQLFAGARKDFSNTGRGKFRAELNILLCGDPGTSKSQLLQYVYHLVPRGQYTSGKGSSAVGLTAYITKDPETRQLVLQTGALVLSDNGVCCIDEFDKMNDSTRSVLHEVMEQQTLSIAKAGIICSLNARTSVLAAANPIESQWNKNKTIIDNIQLPHTLLSRFDLIFLILDPQDEVFDRRLANHLVSLYYQSKEQVESAEINMQDLKDYIGYARSHINPKLSEKASQSLISEYVEMRKIGSGRGQISAYPRQLESLIRLAEAHAKMRLSEVVEIEDVKEARRLQREALKQAAIDPSTGKIDISILTTGVSGAARRQKAERTKALMTIIREMGKVASIKKSVLFDKFKERSDSFVTFENFEESLRELQEDDQLAITGVHVRPIHT